MCFCLKAHLSSCVKFMLKSFLQKSISSDWKYMNCVQTPFPPPLPLSTSTTTTTTFFNIPLFKRFYYRLELVVFHWILTNSNCPPLSKTLSTSMIIVLTDTTMIIVITFILQNCFLCSLSKFRFLTSNFQE